MGEELKNPFKFDENCKLCPRLVKNRRNVVHGYGTAKAKIMFIGLAPGRNGGDFTDVPFTKDPSGEKLQQLLIDSGLSNTEDTKSWKPSLKNVYVTDIVRCCPPKNKPNQKEINNCYNYLKQEIEKIKPKIIVPVGKKATKQIFRHFSIRIDNIKMENLHSKLIPSDTIKVIPMMHPSPANALYNKNSEFYDTSIRTILKNELKNK